MAVFKEVWVFSLGINSWSEVYYTTQSSIAEASLFPEQLLASRLAFLHPDAALVKIRVSNIALLREAVPVTINRPGLYKGTDGPDVTNTSAIITLNSTQFPSSRKIWVRGLPDSYVIRAPISDVDTPPAAFKQALGIWINELVNANYQVQSLVKIQVPPVGGVEFYPATAIVATTGAATATITLGFNWIGGIPPRVVLSQFSPKLLPGLNGHWSNTSTALNQLVVPYNMPQPGPINLTKGRARVELYNYGLIDAPSSGFSFYRSRKTGKSFLGGRGRKTGTRLRSL